MAKKVKISVTGHRRTTAWLAHTPEEPPIKEVLKQIRIEIETMLNSHKEADGVIRNEEAIYKIGCLQEALRILECVNEGYKMKVKP